MSGDVGPMKELINVKDSGVNDLMMKKCDDELLKIIMCVCIMFTINDNNIA